jgi:hypothetical protein
MASCRGGDARDPEACRRRRALRAVARATACPSDRLERQLVFPRQIAEKNTIQQFFSFDPAILAFPLQIPIRYSPRTTSAYSLGSNFSRLKGVPAGVRALLESRERHERRHRTQRIYSNDHDESIHSKISHRSL